MTKTENLLFDRMEGSMLSSGPAEAFAKLLGCFCVLILFGSVTADFAIDHVVAALPRNRAISSGAAVHRCNDRIVLNAALALKEQIPAAEEGQFAFEEDELDTFYSPRDELPLTRRAIPACAGPPRV